MSERPSPPEDYECCESGCDPCIWDTYYANLAQWQAEQAKKNEQPDTDSSDSTGQ